MTAYELRISDWSSGVCSSDLQVDGLRLNEGAHRRAAIERTHDRIAVERAEQEPQPALRYAVIVDDQDIMLCHHAHAPPARYGLISRFCGHRNPNNIGARRTRRCSGFHGGRFRRCRTSAIARAATSIIARPRPEARLCRQLRSGPAAFKREGRTAQLTTKDNLVTS